jgi:hypothetical protein
VRSSPWPRLGATGLLCLGAIVPAPTSPAAAGLRLVPGRVAEAGAVRVAVVSADGAALTSERAARIEVVASVDVAAPVGRWPRWDGPRTLTNGALLVLPEVGGGTGAGVGAGAGAGAGIGTDRRYFAARELGEPEISVTVSNSAGLRAAVAAARPGTRIRIAPGVYAGGFYFANLRGETNRPVVLTAEDPANPPVIQGGGNGIQLTDPAFVELSDLVFAGATGNGLNIDDGGTFGTPARQIVLRGLRVRDVGPEGNRDGIKLSGVVGFRVEGCTVERWGTGGSAVDLVGCHEGVIASNLFRHTPATAAANGTGVQAKGGTRDVVIRRNRFEYAGSRAVNLGGSTGLEFFRPPLAAGVDHWEAKDLVVEGNTFVGSSSPVAFVGVDGAVVRFNTFYRPQRWLLRILQETTAAGFVPCRNGRFEDNLVAFQSAEWSAGGVNIGPNTAPGTFGFARNWWYCLDQPSRSRPTLPVAESGGVYGQSPLFRDAAAGDLRVQPGSPAAGVGAEALP